MGKEAVGPALMSSLSVKVKRETMLLITQSEIVKASREIQSFLGLNSKTHVYEEAH